MSMLGRRHASLLPVLVFLLLSQGAVTWADDIAPLESKEAEESPATNAHLDPAAKLLIWIQQNEGHVRPCTGLQIPAEKPNLCCKFHIMQIKRIGIHL